jgi:hypothetical protein
MRCLLFYGRFDSTPSACGPLYQRHLPPTSSSSSSCVGFVPVSRASCGSFIPIPPAWLNFNFPPARSNRPTILLLLVLPAVSYTSVFRCLLCGDLGFSRGSCQWSTRHWRLKMYSGPLNKTVIASESPNSTPSRRCSKYYELLVLVVLRNLKVWLTPAQWCVSSACL